MWEMKRKSHAFAISVRKWSYLLEVEVLDWILFFHLFTSESHDFFFFFEINGNFDIALIEAKISLPVHRAYVKVYYINTWDLPL